MLSLFINVYLSLLVFNYVYNCILMFTTVYSCMFAHVYSCLPMFAMFIMHVYVCLPICGIAGKNRPTGANFPMEKLICKLPRKYLVTIHLLGLLVT